MKNYIIVLLVLFLQAEAWSASTFSGERLRQGCLDYIYSNLGEDVQVSIAGLLQDQSFDEDDVEAAFVADMKSLRGNTFVIIEFRKDTKLLRRVQIPVRIKIYREAPVAVDNIGKDKELTEDDITYQKLNVTYYSDDEFPSTEEIVGSKAGRNINRGSIITRSLLKDESMIHKGEKVSIVFETGAISIRATGTALQDAVIGSAIRIRRDNSNSVLQGHVTKEGTVLISSL